VIRTEKVRNFHELAVESQVRAGVNNEVVVYHDRESSLSCHRAVQDVAEHIYGYGSQACQSVGGFAAIGGGGDVIEKWLP
jgi:hypothetical protein